MKEALFSEQVDKNAVRCGLCPHGCRIEPGGRGICGVRENAEGRLVTLVHGRPVAINVDPIEKKPLFHFYPGSLSLSIATVGCNLQCLHCQNAEISQMPADQGRIDGADVAPEKVVEMALQRGCGSISYTYTEPTVYFEYALDTARIAAGEGLKNVFVTNGYTTLQALETIQPVLHAANVDLKSFRDSFYRKICKARLDPVLDTIREMVRRGIWVEVTTLVIPGLNDSEEELRDIARFLRGLRIDLPWHVSAFHPTYRLTDRPRTPEATLRRARRIGREEGLLYVYTGNIPGDEGENTDCPGCGKTVIRRHGFRVLSMEIEEGRCRFCRREIPVQMG
ncbi:MAG: AmmeMemoRadiSam system radical SAM enzyme [bacterium]